ncbi:MAG: SDR family NAD(P)-dependent oxidoreductase, partial [Armatimonadota bacterium]|nr:SDR family NAD(P)-dependent oxidoreductase [Armatimonadota bacterium]
ILPPLRELIGGRADFKALREVRMEDLLPRPEVQLDRESISRYLNGRTVLVTGGGGSIGGELCRQALKAGATRLLVLGRGENSVFEMMQELNELNGHCELVPVICDVRDRPALEQVFERYHPQVVFHAAAHKHVPLMEQYPCEAIKNNVVGTLNVVQLAVQYQVERFVLVSTDKAVDPTSVMGATKRLCEMIVQGYAVINGTNMVSVRFGNVLGSRGSVVPTMTRQIRRRLPVTVTDPDMVRYFMTIPEAVQLILQAGAVGGCGEVFILDMGHPVRILDLAHDLIRLYGLVPHQDIAINIVGRRPGEKVREDILTALEAAGAEKNGVFFMATPQLVELSHLLDQIDQLRILSQAGEDEQVVKLIQSILPDFRPDKDTRSEQPAPGAWPMSMNHGAATNGSTSHAAPASNSMTPGSVRQSSGR